MEKYLLAGARVAAGVLVLAWGGFATGSAQAQYGPLGPPTTAKAPQTVEERSKALASLLNDIWQDRLKHSPEFASFLGDKRYNDQWSDYSVKAVNASLERGRVFLDSLGEIDVTGLKPQEILSRDLMVRDLTDAQEAARFKEWEMPVNQFSGFHTDIVQLVSSLSFDTVKDYDDYITRLKKIPTVFSQNMTDMQLGMDEGRVPPAYLLEKVVTQTETIGSQKPDDSPFAQPLKKFPPSISPADRKRISEEMLEAISTTVLPTYQRFARFLKAQYVPAGRKDPGVWALPDGDAYYAFRVRQSTTEDKSPAEIHQIGLDEVKRDETEMLAIAKKLGFNDIKSFNAAMKTNPKLHPTSKEALLDAYKGYIARMQPKLPELFGTLPKAKLEVLPVPAYIEKEQAPAYYNPGSQDGKRPGRVYVNTYNFADRSLATVEAVSYHEGIPGHHLQISIAQELTGLPEFRKQEYFTAYTEGWGLYSERLGKDLGLYQDPYSDYGRLQADIWRAIRLVVDTGVHSQHWTRQQMVDYFHQHSSIDESDIQAEVDRYIAWPGQALGYKMGQLKILELREKAKAALGPKFDLKQFHDVVLDSGALPMDVLAKQVDTWIAAKQK
ncbi:DUF885 domain-containing protein [Edaphobacter sp. HDX4]|uniref:DUF885 domain-containing protein n=1 Tax=Edaphobacter sp. HDX4 TaxID=2794064 RepID=UPI002FE66922